MAVVGAIATVVLELIVSTLQVEGASLHVTPATILVDVAAIGPWIVMAWLAWVTISRAGLRPVIATTSAAVGGILQIVGPMATLTAGIIALMSPTEDPPLQSLGLWIWQISALLAAALLVVAFGTGLADEPDRPSA